LYSSADFEKYDQASIWGFVIGEGIRLAVRPQNLKAPFVKILIRLATLPEARHIRGPYIIDEICETVVGCDYERAVRERTLAPLIDSTAVALANMQSKMDGGVYAELVKALEEVRTSNPPCNRELVKYRKSDRKTGASCSVWFRADLDSFRVEADVKCPRCGERSVVVLKSTVCVYLEDDFPIKDVIVRDGEFQLRDKTKNVLASVPICVSSLT
jgi:hypothetical protein